MNKQVPVPSMDFHITNKCNYRCEYCCQGRGDECFEDNIGNADDQTVDNFLNFISSLSLSFTVGLMGGEPLIHPRFLEVIEKIAKSGHKVSFVTNFSFPLDHYKKIIDVCDDKISSIIASLHLSQVKDLDKFLTKSIELTKYSKEKGLVLDFNVATVVLEDNFEQIKKLHSLFNKHNIKFTPQRLIEDDKAVSYSEEIEKFMDNNNACLDKEVGKNLYGTICYAGCKYFTIKLNGEVHRCYNEQEKFNVLGNINDGNVKIFNNAKPCYSQKCTCSAPYALNMIRFGEKNAFIASLKIKARYIKTHPFFFLSKIKLDKFKDL